MTCTLVNIQQNCACCGAEDNRPHCWAALCASGQDVWMAVRSKAWAPYNPPAGKRSHSITHSRVCFLLCVRHDMRLGYHQLLVFTELCQYQLVTLNGFPQYLLLTNVQQ